MKSWQEQQRAIITGASSGIGKATAVAFAKAGIAVALVGRSQAKLEQVVQIAKSVGTEAKGYILDLAEVELVKAEMSAIAQDFQPIDILVNNAGMGYTNLLKETSLSDWQQVLNLNLTSVFQSTQAILPLMRDRKAGVIINVASIAAHSSFPNWGAYSVSKAGLVAFSKILAAEEKVHGIRVMTVSPGAVNTPIWDTDTVGADFERSLMLTPEVVAQTILYAATLPPGAMIEEITLMPSAGAL
ncbi:SDR family oxidoreductase [Gloeocapsa sp. PCC 73106]|uniref:SDR family oxidoreductase n=1 Tax=Gloeocapsa sp. PCC 73106 TaxID=102232 RepID=UPI0002AC7E63|nr:SDR family oxidoreductase [Gloeocapsa sp. PCC 73106]ELR96978.1 short-chain alcohol dehydrogenase [Gloeocapsa sp. PCC 73106]